MNSLNPSDSSQCADYFKALGDPLRLQIVRALQTGPLSVSDLALLVEQEIGTVSHHLRVLFHADLVQTQREGKYIYYSLKDGMLNGRGKSKQSSLNLGCCKVDMGPMNPDAN
ncbi:metalloregulator ArsR/SmtB family transcription factor [Rhodopirellula sp. JC740]|uniref:Metalloregulator ArsR/SmtB family transcription factor n=1 Tax=Rhodopirellula halodulae TaxID=2894198 RepID=A0ABS8NE14_9BACT|nr:MULTISPECIES: metalloregulator ArsR/SmtB family transcription factor [unclassified Rhodopirellula]MCC9641795.1 metalloregulator ArsR/SmtB family transcription factor [Rhodopirellula sp. JC740]MCC9654790.1 metalloregulator ArsR/SmtB family transcription factor [Rhodopirellula sp. JC737]